MSVLRKHSDLNNNVASVADKAVLLCPKSAIVAWPKGCAVGYLLLGSLFVDTMKAPVVQ